MKKRLIAILLLLCMVFTKAVAEEQEQPKSFLDAIGDWYDQAVQTISEAWEKAGAWMEGAWGDASQWVKQAWNDSAQWATEIWGDVSTWASETYATASDSISHWWTETFNAVTDFSKNTWNWLTQEATELKTTFKDDFEAIRTAILEKEEKQESALQNAYTRLLTKLSLNEEDAKRVWDTVGAYAEQKGISPLLARKLALPYLFQLTVDRSKATDDMPPIAIAQYLTGILEKLNVKSSDEADALIVELTDVLGTV
ncbi:MAG: hypothetical protein IJ174_06330 [Clostridia bacterium]|nr:hypothetical protein [Clostridia bacterium]